MAWDGGLGLPMPQVPGGLGSAEAMTQMAPPVQRMATMRVKKIFGVPVPERRARTFLGGLAGMPQITPGAGIGNFLSGLQGGLRGSLQAGDMFDQRQAEAEQAQVDNAYKQAMIDKMTRPEAPADTMTPEQKNFRAYLAMTPEEREQFGQYRNITDNPRQPGEFERWLAMTPEQRREYETFKKAGVGLTGIVQVVGPDGNPTWVRQGDAIGKTAPRGPAAVTGAERQNLAYYNRAKEAIDNITTPYENGMTLEDQMARMPLPQQAQLRYAPNFLQTPAQQAYRQSQRAFTEARLRKESGAAIPLHEYENDARTYFAQPGDAPATIAQKRAMRQKVLDGLKYTAGRAYDEYYGGGATETGGADLIYNPQTGELEPAR